MGRLCYDAVRDQHGVNKDGDRGDAVGTTFTHKDETGLFGGQCLLCGGCALCDGASALMKVWY